jgi:hypothetical protein
MKKFIEFVSEEKDPNEYDQEGEMAITLLNNVIDAAEDLILLLEDDENLPEWAQAKITKAEDYLDSVRDYMMNLGDDEDEEEDDEDMNEAAYAGNLGFMEIAKFYQKATDEEKKKLQELISNKQEKQAWKMVQNKVGIKLVGKGFN